MGIVFDPDKRRETLENRGLDFADAKEVFAGDGVTVEDDRQDYGEQRFRTAGFLSGRHRVDAAGWITTHILDEACT